MLKTSGIHELPESCYVVIAGLAPGGNVAIARRGRLGVEVTSMNFGNEKMARAAVRVVNQANGVSAAVERTMLAGAMFGWDRERAEPAFLKDFDRRFRDCESATAGVRFAGLIETRHRRGRGYVSAQAGRNRKRRTPGTGPGVHEAFRLHRNGGSEQPLLRKRNEVADREDQVIDEPDVENTQGTLERGGKRLIGPADQR